MSNTEAATHGLCSRKDAHLRWGWVDKRGDRDTVRRGLRTHPCSKPPVHPFTPPRPGREGEERVL